METTIETFSFRTPAGCWVYGHRNLTDGGQFITLASEAPPMVEAMRALPVGQGVDLGGRSWP